VDSLFEFGLLLLILLYPLLGGLGKKRRPKGDGSGEGGPGATGGGLPEESVPERGEGFPWSEAEDEASADVLVPDDLWEVLTGERRSPGRRGGEAEERPDPDRDEELRGEGRDPHDRDWAAHDRDWDPHDGDLDPYQRDRDRSDEALPAEPPPGLGAPIGKGPRAREGAEEGEGRVPRRLPRSLGRSVAESGMRRRGRRKKEHPREALGPLTDRPTLRRAVLWREVLGPPVSLRDDEA